MSDVKYGVILGDMEMSAKEVVRLGPKIEELDFDSIWMADHLIDLEGAISDPYTVFGYLAAVTDKVTFCAAVSDCQRIHPAKMAHIVATLDEISDGRAALGIGAGEAMNTLPFNLPFEDDPKIRLNRLKEYIQVTKLLWSSSIDNPVSFTGEHYNLTDAWIDQKPITKPHPAIHVGALGSNTALRITAELGDGWQPFFSTPEYYTKRLNYLNEHAVKYGRDPKSIEPSVWVYMHITDDENETEKLLRELSVFCIAERGSLKHSGFDISKLPSKQFHFARLIINDSARIEKIVEAANTIPLELIKKMHCVGTVDDVCDFFKTHIKAGVRHFLINPCVSSNPDSTLETFSKKVMPRLKGES